LAAVAEQVGRDDLAAGVGEQTRGHVPVAAVVAADRLEGLPVADAEKTTLSPEPAGQ
jgi:hypothetical protein